MKLGDLSKVRVLSEELLMRRGQLAAIEADERNLSISIGSRYLPSDLLETIKPTVKKVLENEVCNIENELRALGVDADA